VVAYISTPSVIPQLPYGKPFPGEDPNAKWFVYLSRSINLTSGSPSWTQQRLTPKAIHTGDVCTLGIFCTPGQVLKIQNRDLLDFIDVVMDPSGMVHIAYTDTEAKKGSATIFSADQLLGVSLLAPKPSAVKAVRRTAPGAAGRSTPATGVHTWTIVGVMLLAGSGLVRRSLRAAR
jgi:hypothetical protein